MGLSEEFAVLRKRLADLELAIDRANKDRPDGQASMTGRVFNDGAMPSTVPAFFAVHPVDIGGAEVEGGSITFTESTGVVYFLVIGPDVPEVGDVLSADSCGGRWVAEHQVGEEAADVVIADCGCDTTPVTLYMHATRPDLNSGLFNDATLVYGPNPAPFDSGFAIPPSNHWSVETFDNGINTFRYMLFCSIAQYRLNVCAITGTSSPAITERYTWAPFPSAPGNACSPFYLLNGVMYSGGNATNKNYISGTAGDWQVGRKLITGNCRTSGFVSVPGVTVSCDGSSGVSNALGDFAFTLAQSASSRPWSAVKTGYTTATGSVAGQALDATVPQYVTINVVINP